MRGRQWAEVFRRRAPEIEFRIWPDVGDAAQVRFLAAWEPPQDLAERFPLIGMAGFSLGGSLALLTLGRQAERVPAQARALVAVSAPLAVLSRDIESRYAVKR